MEGPLRGRGWSGRDRERSRDTRGGGRGHHRSDRDYGRSYRGGRGESRSGRGAGRSEDVMERQNRRRGDGGDSETTRHLSSRHPTGRTRARSPSTESKVLQQQPSATLPNPEAKRFKVVPTEQFLDMHM